MPGNILKVYYISAAKAPRDMVTYTEWWYNTSYHSTIRMTPFETLYGIKPPQLALGLYQQSM